MRKRRHVPQLPPQGKRLRKVRGGGQILRQQQAAAGIPAVGTRNREGETKPFRRHKVIE